MGWLKVLVVYDTFSPLRVTEKVAELICGVFKEKAFEVECQFVGDVVAANVKGYDCVVVGAPTMYFRASPRIKQFLDGLPKGEFSGKLATAFGTQMKTRFSGSAAKGIEGKLRDLRFKLVSERLETHVGGQMNEMQPMEGEMEKTRSWAQSLAETLSK